MASGEPERCRAAPATTPINGHGFVVPDPSAEFIADSTLSLGATGDVLAARAAARALLARGSPSAPNHALSTLVLTAALLHADTLVFGAPAARDVGTVLRGLVSAPAATQPMAASRVQFAAYAAAELGVLPPGGQLALVDQLLNLVDPDGETRA